MKTNIKKYERYLKEAIDEIRNRILSDEGRLDQNDLIEDHRICEGDGVQ